MGSEHLGQFQHQFEFIHALVLFICAKPLQPKAFDVRLSIHMIGATKLKVQKAAL